MYVECVVTDAEKISASMPSRPSSCWLTCCFSPRPGRSLSFLRWVCRAPSLLAIGFGLSSASSIMDGIRTPFLSRYRSRAELDCLLSAPWSWPSVQPPSSGCMAESTAMAPNNRRGRGQEPSNRMGDCNYGQATYGLIDLIT